MTNEELPTGWAKAPLAKVVDVLDSKRVPLNSGQRERRISGKSEKDLVPYYGATGQVGFIDDALFNEPLVLLGEDGVPFFDPLRHKAYRVSGRTWVNNHAHVLRARPEVADDRFITAFLNSFDYTGYVSGSTRLKLTQGSMNLIPVTLAPLPEQKRIADKLEAVLGRVDACRTRLDRVPALLKRFRQSVLAAAMSGALTEEWREQYDAAENADGLLKRIQNARKAQWKGKYKELFLPNENFLRQPPSTWRIASMDALTSLITSGSRDWTKYYRDEGYAVFVMAQNVRLLRFDSSPVIRVAPPSGDRDKARSEIRRDDLLVTIVGANTGDVCRVPSDFPDYYVCQSVALLRPAISETSKYLELFLASDEHGQEQFDEYGYGQGRPHLSFDQLRSTAVFLPPLSEQTEIVRRVEALFALADRIEARLATAQATVARLTPATLAKAFRGELVPQNPDDEPAAALLARLQQETVNLKPKRRSRIAST